MGTEKAHDYYPAENHASAGKETPSHRLPKKYNPNQNGENRIHGHVKPAFPTAAIKEAMVH